MDYTYENLGPDRFQEFCQALLAKPFPNLQCLPTRQPDGGRDAIAYYDEGKNGSFTVFQIKFVEKPLAKTDVHSWLRDTLEKESPKIEKLIPKGAKEYYLLTNVPGTAHLDSGSIDKVNEILKTTISVPAYCWWRDDLNQRLDGLWDLKWSYPELLSGLDVLGYLVQSRLHEDKKGRMGAIRAFLRDQYKMDQKVRFKQVDLQSNLLDLFIDVPMILPNHTNRKQRSRYTTVAQDIEWQEIASGRRDESRAEAPLASPSWFFGESDVGVGTARMLLHPAFQDSFPQIVLEGAPGQGKSTIVQYVCQLHRMKILNLVEALNQIPASHKSTNVRIPFKVDLRDYATWLEKQDPFSADESNEVPQDWNKSLESFLAAQVRHYSGGLAFSVDDLIHLARVSPLLIVLDGLDEVADIHIRKGVVEEVMRSVDRLRENAESIQVIITSRPAAFANSPGFPEKTFSYYELDSIDTELISDYADKWIRARRLHGREGADVRRILRSKLDQSHLRDLARNPMQLSILLNLIHTRGSSLPDKRTALYDNYMELFFNREAEKSTTVRDYRDLLIDIHQYLAWILHSEAENGHSRGSISTERLRRLLEDYLVSEGRDRSIVERLFAGMVERVVALVSRVQGTYEFEVQPLREYFAARFLYETAPYSPPGGEAQGTKSLRQ